MQLTEFRDLIAANPGCGLRVELADGAALADHFHVTEVGRVEKDFFDCGGVRRHESRCVLQTLVAGDIEHRLSSTKLSGILAVADNLDLPPDAAVEVEHQERSVATDVVERVERRGDTLVILLAPKQTACLAEDACGIPSGLPQLTTIDGCCSGGSGCC